MHKGPGGLAEPPDTIGNLVNSVPQVLENPEDKILEDWDVFFNLTLDSGVVLGL